MPPPSLTRIELTSLGAHSGGDDPDDLSRLRPFRPVRRSPAVEGPVHCTKHIGTVVVDDEGGPEVTHPEFVERHLDELDLGGQHSSCPLDLSGVDHHADRFEFDDGQLSPHRVRVARTPYCRKRPQRQT